MLGGTTAVERGAPDDCDDASPDDQMTPPLLHSDAWKRDVRALGLVVLGCALLLALALHTLVVSALTAAEWEQLRLPTSLATAQQLGDALQALAARAPARLLLAHMCCYLFLQTFAIPGTVFFNLLGGALFGVARGFPLCLAYNTLGSVFMYLLSRRFGRRAVRRLFPSRLAQLRAMVDAHRDDLALYMIFLRVFPFTPNWFINVASPHLAIPLPQFALGPLVGLIPYNFLSCQAGLVLRELRSKGDIIDTVTTVQLVGVAIAGAVLLPRLKKRFATPAAASAASTKQD
ncbi:hypothetical protein PybrP1_004878 [[Pythium] brassicae (nom. inval.)]|nr:hypothetical protein PybrP1_004878 [[Pythium] brassicae (nom. inval.)]